MSLRLVVCEQLAILEDLEPEAYARLTELSKSGERASPDMRRRVLVNLELMAQKMATGNAIGAVTYAAIVRDLICEPAAPPTAPCPTPPRGPLPRPCPKPRPRPSPRPLEVSDLQGLPLWSDL